MAAGRIFTRRMSEKSQPRSLRAWREQRQSQESQILEQFPEIEEAQFTLTWELELGDSAEDRFWVVKHGERIIYREEAKYEDYHRFEVLARLLKEKYGSRVKDLVPVEANDARFYLYGDFLGAVRRVEDARKRNFGSVSG